MGDYLFAQPTLFSGVARTLDLGATFDSYNDSPTPRVADNIALFLDLRAVGEDLAVGIERRSKPSGAKPRRLSDRA